MRLTNEQLQQAIEFWCSQRKGTSTPPFIDQHILALQKEQQARAAPSTEPFDPPKRAIKSNLYYVVYVAEDSKGRLSLEYTTTSLPLAPQSDADMSALRVKLIDGWERKYDHRPVACTILNMIRMEDA